MDKKDFMNDIIQEGVGALFNKLGTVKATKFLQIFSIPRGDSVEEIESKTKGFSKQKALDLISAARNKNPQLWGKLGLL